MSDTNKIIANRTKLSHKLENDFDTRSTPTSPLTTRWKFQLNGIETLKNSTSEPNVSAKVEKEKTANDGNNSKRNSKSEDCLLELDKSCGDILSSTCRQSCEETQPKNQIDDIFTRALKERLGLKTEVVNPGRVMVLNEENGGGMGGPVAPGGAGDGGGLIAPRRLTNPCLESAPRQDLHRELMFNQKIGKNVLNQKSELERALSKHKEKKIINQEKDQKEAPELARAIAERARRIEESKSNKNGNDKIEEAACNPQYIEARARLRHAK